MTTNPQIIVPAGQGTRLELRRGQSFRVVDLEGKQVADLLAVSARDPGEWLSSGRTFDHEGTILLTEGHVLHSNRSRPMLALVRDTAGRHDFLHAACSPEMFRIQYGVRGAHTNCLENLARCLEPELGGTDAVMTPFNVFMHVDVDPVSGALAIRPPSSGPGDYLELRAELDLVVAVSACSAERTNQGRLKPIAVEVLADEPGG